MWETQDGDVPFELAMPYVSAPENNSIRDLNELVQLFIRTLLFSPQPIPQHLEIAGRHSIYRCITLQSDHGQYLHSGQSVWKRNYHVYEDFNLGSVVHSNMRVEVRLTDKSTAES